VGLGRFELPTLGLGIQRAVLIGVENFVRCAVQFNDSGFCKNVSPRHGE